MHQQSPPPHPAPVPDIAELRPLSAGLVDFIAAGETIDSPAAAVRELLDNAVDAGATRITVSLDLARGWIRVVDNGAGMDLASLRLAAIAHTTSKLRDQPGLERITSLGFRGEALHSLAQLSSLTIASRSHDTERLAGWRVEYDPQGRAIAEEPVAIAPGTIVEIDQLFAPLPARQDSLPSLPQQLRSIQLTVQNAAIAHPSITWQVYKQKRRWLSLGPGTTARDILPQVLPSVRYGDLQYRRSEIPLPERSPHAETSSDNGSESSGSESNALGSNALGSNASDASPSTAAVEIVLGLPDRAHRRRLDWVRVMVNGRLVQMPEMVTTITAAFQRTLPRDRYPIAVVHLKIPPGWVDWNRTPSKQEIYLRQGEGWSAQVRQAIAETLAIAPTPDGYQTQRVRKLLTVAEPTGTYSVEDEHPGTLLEPAMPTLRAVGQVNQTYIVAEHPGGVWLVEQHIAHERVLFEEWGDRWTMLPLPQPLIMQGLSEGDRDRLTDIGIEMDDFGENLWAIRNVPAPLVDRDDLDSTLRELAKVDDYDGARAAIACRTALKNGTPLDLTEMQKLLNQWQQTKNSRTCPHGRPIYLSLEETSLARFFRRHWVIGKSHGI